MLAALGSNFECFRYCLINLIILFPGSVADNFELNSTETVLNPDPMFRPCFAVLLTDPLFSGGVTQIVDSLSNITLKSKEEKEEFFSSLPLRLQEIPDDTIVRLILPLLINRFIFNEPAAIDHLLPHLLVANRNTASTSNGLLPVQLYKDHVLPMIINLFTVHEVNIRLSLLQYWPHYVLLCDRDVLHEDILPELLLGLQDDNPLIVSSTFRALSDLVPVLGVQAVTGEEPDHIFVENKPRFAAGSLSSKLHSPQSLSSSAHKPSLAQSPKSSVESGLVNDRKTLLEKREKRRKQQQEARKQRELRHDATAHRRPMKLVQAVKVYSNTIHEEDSEERDLKVDHEEGSEEKDLEMESNQAEQEEERKEAEKRIREMEQLQRLADARLKGMSQKEIDAWDEALSARDRRSSSDDDWETTFTEPVGSHEKPSSRKSTSRQNSQQEKRQGSWGDFNAFGDHGGADMKKSVTASQSNTRTLKDQKNPSTNKFVDFLDMERQERERLEAMSGQLDRNDIDLFADMQPIVAKKKKSDSKHEVKRSTALNYTVNDTVDEGEWGDGDWGDDVR
jgi:SCY1-like protein 3